MYLGCPQMTGKTENSGRRRLCRPAINGDEPGFFAILLPKENISVGTRLVGTHVHLARDYYGFRSS